MCSGVHAADDLVEDAFGEPDEQVLGVVDGDDLNVLGMNYLTSLKRWSVEGRWLVLEG